MKTNPHLIKAAAIAQMKGEEKIHFLNSNAVRINKSLGDAVGLKNLGVHIIQVEPGFDTTEYHQHSYEEECVYILSGCGMAIIEGESFALEAGDFLGFPCDGAAHGIRNNGHEMLVCLVMGQRLEQDVSDYPNKGKRLYRNSGRWDLLDKDDIETIL